MPVNTARTEHRGTQNAPDLGSIAAKHIIAQLICPVQRSLVGGFVLNKCLRHLRYYLVGGQISASFVHQSGSECREA